VAQVHLLEREDNRLISQLSILQDLIAKDDRAREGFVARLNF
jgi:hypothetical protein